jgi:hypothetical protein
MSPLPGHTPGYVFQLVKQGIEGSIDPTTEELAHYLDQAELLDWYRLKKEKQEEKTNTAEALNQRVRQDRLNRLREFYGEQKEIPPAKSVFPPMPKMLSNSGIQPPKPTTKPPSFDDQKKTTDKIPEELVQCFCHQNAVRFVDRRIGPSRGRSYYRCKRPAPNTCKFPQWADVSEQDKPRPTSAPTVPPKATSSADTSGVYELPPNLKIPKGSFQVVPTDEYVFPAVNITAPTVPLSEDQVQKALDAGNTAAEKAVTNAALSMTGYWGTTKHGHNRLKPANSLQELQAYMEENDPVFKRLSYPESWQHGRHIRTNMKLQK